MKLDLAEIKKQIPTRASLAALQKRLQGLQVDAVACIGHEPYLSGLATQLLCGKAHAFQMEFKKAGACALEIDWKSRDRVLLWHLSAKQLRQSAKSAAKSAGK